MSRFAWCKAFIHLKGRPISFEGRPYLQAVYDTAARRTVLRCSRQVEKTTFICNVVAHAAVSIPGVHIVVVFPRREQAMVFAKSRLLPVLTQSPVLRRVLLGKTPRKPQITHMRFLNKSEIYIRAAYHSADAVRGIDADYLLIDEYQDIAGGDLAPRELIVKLIPGSKAPLEGVQRVIPTFPVYGSTPGTGEGAMNAVDAFTPASHSNNPLSDLSQ